MSMKSSPAAKRTADPRLPVRAGRILRVRAVWAIPLLVGSVVVSIMTALYIGSVVNPLAHVSGLPVVVVNQDRGAKIGSQHLEVGQQVQAGLLASPEVTSRLHLVVATLPQAEQSMSRDGQYAAVVIPPDFTTNLLSVSGLRPGETAVPHIQILTNQRAGTVGVELATGVLTPALTVASHQIGQHLSALVPASRLTGATKAILANPVTVTTVQYRPLPANSALGLSAFYVALLTLMCGFLGATIANPVVDAALGYATNEIGPRWRQRPPVPINRWQTLLIKWAIIVVLTGLVTAVMLAVAVAGLGMDAPHSLVLWLYTWLCAASVGIGTLVLFAVFGTFGQLIGILLFVYAGLASAGGTVPVEALPPFLHALSYIEPLRQVLEGTRSILYFDAQADAGLTRGTLAAGLGLLFWLVIGAAIVNWYDRKRFYRLDPDILDYVSTSVQEYRSQHLTAAVASDTSRRPSGEVSSEQPRGTDDDNRPTKPGGTAADD
jgi:YhgE/Pip-like protein